MKSVLAMPLAALVLGAGLAASPAAANPLFSIDAGDSFLWSMDPFGTGFEGRQRITHDTDEICQGLGLAADPADGTLFGVLGVNGCYSNADRKLATIDPATGAATMIASFGNVRVGGIAFCEGVTTELYAVSGVQGTNPESLFLVDKATGAATKKCTLRSGQGHAIASNRGMLFHVTRDPNNGLAVVEVIDPTNLPGNAGDPCPSTEFTLDVDITPTGATAIGEDPDTYDLNVFGGYFLYDVSVATDLSGANADLDDSLFHYSKGGAWSQAPVTQLALEAVPPSVRSYRVNGKKRFVMSYTVYNAGPDPAANVTASVSIPFGTVLFGTSVAGGGSCTDLGGLVRCDTASLPAFSTFTFEVQVQKACRKCSRVTSEMAVWQPESGYDNPANNFTSLTFSLKGKL